MALELPSIFVFVYWDNLRSFQFVMKDDNLKQINYVYAKVAEESKAMQSLL